MSLLSCILHFSLKHIGIATIYYITFFYIYYGTKIGIKRDNENAYNEARIKELELNNNDINNNNNNSIKKTNNIAHSNSYAEILSASNISVDEDSNVNEILDIINVLQSLHIKGFFIYIIYITTIITIDIKILIDIYKNKNNNKYNIDNIYNDNIYNMEKDNNGEWIYKCPTIPYDGIFNLFEFLLLILLLLKIKTVLKYVYIFKLVKYLCYSGYVWIAMGPLINVMNYYINALYTLNKYYIIN